VVVFLLWKAMGNTVVFLFFGRRFAMFTTLINMGTYRVDYFHPEMFFTAAAAGLYLSAVKGAGEFYSRTMKHRLLNGLCYLKQTSDVDNLVAVYVDNLTDESSQRMAFEQMMKDIHRGILHRVFVHCHTDLSSSDGFLALVKGHSFRSNGHDLYCWDERTSFTVSFLQDRCVSDHNGDRSRRDPILQMLEA
jgi:hypothetical protein